MILWTRLIKFFVWFSDFSIIEKYKINKLEFILNYILVMTNWVCHVLKGDSIRTKYSA